MTLNQDQRRKALISVIGMTPSAEQLGAIEAPLEPGLIVAGAGTGKTVDLLGSSIAGAASTTAPASTAPPTMQPAA